MSVSDTGFDFADLVDEASARAGGESTTAAEIIGLRRSLRVLTERWAASGFNSWRVKTTRVGLSGATGEVPLPHGVDDVIVVQAVNSNSNNISSMRRIPASAYGQLTSKSTKGRPSQWWLNRLNDRPTLKIFPIGDQQNDTIEIQYVERPDQFARYTDTNDVAGRWLECLVMGMALELARKRPPYNEGLIQRLKMEYGEAEVIAQQNDRDRARYRFRM